MFSATSEAITSLESFTITPIDEASGTFEVQTQQGKYLSVKASSSSKASASVEVRGDASESSLETIIRVRMQARFKPRLKSAIEEKAKEKVSRRVLEEAVGRKLDDDEVKKLKRARRDGDYHELLLDMKVKNKHDKYG
jgi:protein FRG1